MEPFTFAQARDASQEAGRGQRAAEDFMQSAARDYAAAEESYRVALAKKILELHEEGIAWSACGDLARGDEQVAQLKRARDICEGVLEAAKQASWRHAADRRDTERLIDWSMRRELAEGFGSTREPDRLKTFGSGVAA